MKKCCCYTGFTLALLDIYKLSCSYSYNKRCKQSTSEVSLADGALESCMRCYAEISRKFPM